MSCESTTQAFAAKNTQGVGLKKDHAHVDTDLVFQESISAIINIWDISSMAGHIINLLTNPKIKQNPQCATQFHVLFA